MLRNVESYLELLCLVARAEGGFKAKERSYLRNELAKAKIGKSSATLINKLLDPKVKVDTDAVLMRIARRIEPPLLAEALRDAYVAASSDGIVAPAEVTVIEKLLAAMGYAKRQREVLHQWARMAANHQLDGYQLVLEGRKKRSPAAAKRRVTKP